MHRAETESKVGALRFRVPVGKTHAQIEIIETGFRHVFINGNVRVKNIAIPLVIEIQFAVIDVAIYNSKLQTTAKRVMEVLIQRFDVRNRQGSIQRSKP